MRNTGRAVSHEPQEERLTDLLVVCDGSCDWHRQNLGLSAQLYWSYDTSTPLREIDAHFAATLVDGKVTAGMGELGSLYLALQLTKNYLCEVDWAAPLQIKIYNDCLEQIENAVLYDDVGLTGINAGHLVA